MHRTLRTRRLAVLALAGLLAGTTACGGEEDPVEAVPTTQRPTTTVPPTTTTAVPVTTWPLLGVPTDDQAGIARSAVVAKIDNSADARPHAGINQADLVYEVWVEGITRFGAVFHSTPADPVGPVRSARSTDIDLIGNLHRPLLVWSGGNPGVTGQVRQAQSEGVLVDVSHSVGAAHYWRQPGRAAPHNLFTNVSAIRDNFSPPDATGPGPLFAYRTGDAPLEGGVPVAGAVINFGMGSVVQYAWDSGRGCWRRYQTDGRHPRPESAFVDEAGQQVCPANVVVMMAQYGPSQVDARSPQAYTVGDGDAIVFSSGHMSVGRWSRPAREAAPVLTTPDGTGIGLAPGRTWVAVPRVGSIVGPMSPEEAAELATYAR